MVASDTFLQQSAEKGWIVGNHAIKRPGPDRTNMSPGIDPVTGKAHASGMHPGREGGPESSPGKNQSRGARAARNGRQPRPGDGQITHQGADGGLRGATMSHLEKCVIKGREERPAESTRGAESPQNSRGYRSSTASVPVGLHLNIQPDRGREPPQNLFERRDPLTGEGPAEPAPGIETPELCKRSLGNPAPSVGGPPETPVMMNDQVAVQCHPNVQLDHLRPLVHCPAKRRHRVFRGK